MNTVSPEQVGVSSARLKRLDEAMNRLIDQGKIAGLVTMLARRGQLFHVGCYGLADRERNRPMQTDTLFRLWSVTKAITTTALLTLYEQGHFVLDQDIADFIPAFRETKVFAGMDSDQPRLVDKERPITIRNLLTHTTGLASGFIARDTLPEREMAGFLRPLRYIDTTLEKLVDGFAQIPLAAQPNTVWLYGQSFEIAARLVEIISGKPFAAYLQETLFEPLGMVDSGYTVSAAKLDRFSAMYTNDKDGCLKLIEDPEKSPHYRLSTARRKVWWTPGGHGLVSSPADLYRFASMLGNRGELDGARILAPATVSMMGSNHLPPALLPVNFMGSQPIWGYGHGLGVHALMDRGLAGVLCSNGEFWKDGGSGTLFWVDPQQELVGIVLYQLDPFWVHNIFAKVKTLTYQALDV